MKCMRVSLFSGVIIFQLSLGMQNATTLSSLPPDVKQCLLPFVASGFPARAVRELCTFATISKEFKATVNNENVMCYFFNEYNKVTPYKAHVVDLGKRLQAMPILFPVMGESKLRFFVYSMERKLKAGSQLFSAVRRYDTPKIQKLLLQEEIDLNWLRSTFDVSPLYDALIRNNSEAVELLLNAGANPDFRAHLFSDTDFLRWLLNFGMNPNLKVAGTRFLVIFSALGHKEEVKMLLKAGANPDLTNKAGKTARDYAWEKRNEKPVYVKIFNILTRVSFERKQKLLTPKKQQGIA